MHQTNNNIELERAKCLLEESKLILDHKILYECGRMNYYLKGNTGLDAEFLLDELEESVNFLKNYFIILKKLLSD
jgi:hypothetical protein